MNGKTAIVTGASSGIGEATAARLAKAGYKVYGTSRRGARGERSFAMLALDVTSDNSVEAAVAEVMRRDGRIDLLVNNAGFTVAPAGAEESSIEQSQSIFDTNFFGVVRMTRRWSGRWDAYTPSSLAWPPSLARLLESWPRRA